MDLLTAEADVMVQAVPRGFKGGLTELTMAEVDIVVKVHLDSQAGRTSGRRRASGLASWRRRTHGRRTRQRRCPSNHERD